MNQFEVIQIIALVGWLVLAVSAFASFRLNWKTSLRHALIWAVIITALMLLVTPFILHNIYYPSKGYADGQARRSYALLP